MKKLRVGVVGVGHIGTNHARIYSELASTADFTAIYDLDSGRANSIAKKYGGVAAKSLDEFAELVDAASIATPTNAHHEIALPLLERGKHLLVEKPIAENPQHATALAEMAAKNQLILQVGHVERFNPVVIAAREVATRPQFFEIHRLAAFSPRSLDIDVVLDLMIHDLDIVLSLVVSPVKEVRAVGIPVLSRKADIANARVEFEDGCVANLTASRVSFERMRKLRFFQPHDYISIDYDTQQGSMVSLRMGQVIHRKLEPTENEPLRLELSAFIEATAQRRPPVVSGEDGLKALELGISINDQIEGRSKRVWL